MFSSFFQSRQWSSWAYGGGLFIIFLVWCQVETLVYLNSWFSYFWDLLQNAKQYADHPQEGLALMHKYLFSFDYYAHGLTGKPSFAVIIIPYILLTALVNWFTRLYALRWRQAMTHSYITRWKHVKHEIEGSSQRIQEDCSRFARIMDSLGVDFIRAILTLLAFVPILWTLSASTNLPFIGKIPGSLVWLVITCSLGGLVLSWIIGGKLPALEYNNQKAEAAFRKDLVLGEDDKQHYAQPNVLTSLFLDIRANYQSLFRHFCYFEIWSRLYSRFMFIMPFIMLGPGLFTGVLTLGTLVQIKNAFSEVDENFSLLLKNWVTITELRSIYKRLSEFERNLQHYCFDQFAASD